MEIVLGSIMCQGHCRISMLLKFFWTWYQWILNVIASMFILIALLIEIRVFVFHSYYDAVAHHIEAKLLRLCKRYLRHTVGCRYNTVWSNMHCTCSIAVTLRERKSELEHTKGIPYLAFTTRFGVPILRNPENIGCVVNWTGLLSVAFLHNILILIANQRWLLNICFWKKYICSHFPWTFLKYQW